MRGKRFYIAILSFMILSSSRMSLGCWPWSETRLYYHMVAAVGRQLSVLEAEHDRVVAGLLSVELASLFASYHRSNRYTIQYEEYRDAFHQHLKTRLVTAQGNAILDAATPLFLQAMFRTYTTREDGRLKFGVAMTVLKASLSADSTNVKISREIAAKEASNSDYIGLIGYADALRSLLDVSDDIILWTHFAYYLVRNGPSFEFVEPLFKKDEIAKTTLRLLTIATNTVEKVEYTGAVPRETANFFLVLFSTLERLPEDVNASIKSQSLEWLQEVSEKFGELPNAEQLVKRAKECKTCIESGKREYEYDFYQTLNLVEPQYSPELTKEQVAILLKHLERQIRSLKSERVASCATRLAEQITTILSVTPLPEVIESNIAKQTQSIFRQKIFGRCDRLDFGHELTSWIIALSILPTTDANVDFKLKVARAVVFHRTPRINLPKMIDGEIISDSRAVSKHFAAQMVTQPEILMLRPEALNQLTVDVLTWINEVETLTPFLSYYARVKEEGNDPFSREIKRTMWSNIVDAAQTMISVGELPTDLHFADRAAEFCSGLFALASVDVPEVLEHRRAISKVARFYIDLAKKGRVSVFHDRDLKHHLELAHDLQLLDL